MKLELRPERTCQRGAGQAGQTASAQGRCTCCSSFRNQEQEGPESAHQPPVSSHSHRSSSPKQTFASELSL